MDFYLRTHFHLIFISNLLYHSLNGFFNFKRWQQISLTKPMLNENIIQKMLLVKVERGTSELINV